MEEFKLLNVALYHIQRKDKEIPIIHYADSILDKKL